MAKNNFLAQNPKLYITISMLTLGANQEVEGEKKKMREIHIVSYTAFLVTF